MHVVFEPFFTFLNLYPIASPTEAAFLLDNISTALGYGVSFCPIELHTPPMQLLGSFFLMLSSVFGILGNLLQRTKGQYLILPWNQSFSTFP